MINEEEFDAYSTDAKVDFDFVNSKNFFDQFNNLAIFDNVVEKLIKESRNILKLKTNTHFEILSLIDIDNGSVKRFAGSKLKSAIDNSTGIEITKYLKRSNSHFVMIHNHPDSTPPSLNDIRGFTSGKRSKVKIALVIGHNGNLYSYTKSKVDIPSYVVIDDFVNDFMNLGYDKQTALHLAVEDLQSMYKFEIGGMDND